MFRNNLKTMYCNKKGKTTNIRNWNKPVSGKPKWNITRSAKKTAFKLATKITTNKAQVSTHKDLRAHRKTTIDFSNMQLKKAHQNSTNVRLASKSGKKLTTVNLLLMSAVLSIVLPDVMAVQSGVLTRNKTVTDFNITTPAEVLNYMKKPVSDPKKLTFLFTGDPQYCNANKNRNKNSTMTFSKIQKVIQERIDISGVIIPGDLTENTRIYDEFKMYENNIRPFASLVYDTQGNHDLAVANWYQKLACWVRHSACVSYQSIEAAIRNRPRAENICLSRQGGAMYSWFWKGVHFISLGLGDIAGKSNFPNGNNGLDFLAEDLKSVPRTTPIVIFLHYYIYPSEMKLLNRVTHSHNLILTISGHYHYTRTWCYLRRSKKHSGFKKHRFYSCYSPSALKGSYGEISISESMIKINGGSGRRYRRHHNIVMNASVVDDFDWQRCAKRSDEKTVNPCVIMAAGIMGFCSIVKCSHFAYKWCKSRCGVEPEDASAIATVETTAE